MKKPEKPKTSDPAMIAQGRVLKRLREGAGLFSHPALASQLWEQAEKGPMGVIARDMIWKLENGERPLTEDTKKTLATFYNVEPAQLDGMIDAELFQVLLDQEAERNPTDADTRDRNWYHNQCRSIPASLRHGFIESIDGELPRLTAITLREPNPFLVAAASVTLKWDGKRKIVDVVTCSASR